jgi:cob(I)alamin adenosyltransferase
MPNKKRQGLIIVNTGDGKGKTTSAFGVALRASGYDWKILIIQFIKGSWKYGEMESIKKFPNIKFVRMGKGFVGIIDDKLPFEEHVKSAQEALEFAKEQIKSDKYDLIILDEINYAVQGKLIKIEDVIELLKLKPPGLHIILTGRNARPELIEMADMVTEMKEIKHPYQKGIKAQVGIDF